VTEPTAAGAAEPQSFWSANAVLGDGDLVSIRPITPADAERLDEFHRRQSPDSIYRRYFTPKPQLSERQLEHFTNVDLVDRVALVVESHGELLGWASYERWPGRDDADTSFMVDDAHHGKGIATLLLEHLAAIAKANGIERFTAEVLGENRPMLAVFARAGWPLRRRYESGVIEVDFPIADTPEFVDSVSRREQRADSRAMARMLFPRAIAVIGASDRPGTVGDVLWRNVTSSASIPVHAVNPNRQHVGSDPSYARVSDIPADISLAAIAVPAESLPATIADCIAARVRGAIVMTSVDGTEIDVDELIATARSNGMRIIGPASMGVASSNPDAGLDASLLPARLTPGHVAISMQSGSLGASLLQLASNLDVGLSWFVSLGDKSDVSGNDLLQFWEDDESTRVIGLYLETLGNPRRFARIARRVSQRRPIVAVRTGVVGGSALYQHCGLIEVPTVVALLDTARMMATQPVLRGDRVAVLANYPSARSLASAAIEAAGMRSVDPPARLDWRSTAGDYGAAITATLGSPDIDGLMVIYTPPLAHAVAPVDDIDAAATKSAKSSDREKPVVAVLLATPDGPIKPGSAVPNFMFPEAAAVVLGRSWAYGRWLQTEAAASPAVVTGIDVVRAEEILDGALDAGATQLDPVTTAEVLTAYGINVPPTRFVPASDAVGAAAEIGFPVAIKARHRHVGRSVRAGVALDLVDAADVGQSINVMRAELGDDADFVVVQAMTTPGVDLRIHGAASDEVGPLMAVGIGGIQAGLLSDDDPTRLAPLSTLSAEGLVAVSRVGHALDQAGIDPAAFVDTLIRAAQLIADHAEITTLDLNPVITTSAGCCVTDAVVTIAPVARPATALRRL
jgi:acyl-CoA synthetase (NDP forming)/GNAT superfamily N-acetyltransferase